MRQGPAATWIRLRQNDSKAEGMAYRVLTVGDRQEWMNCLSRLPEDLQDIYFRPEYLALYGDYNRRVECFVSEAGGEIGIYPFLRFRIRSLQWTDLQDEYYDIEGVYGYNGFVASTRDLRFTESCMNDWQQYCREQHVVAEFLRVNPLLQNDMVLGHLELIKMKKNVVVDLSVSPEDLWMRSYEHCVRKNVNKAREAGLIAQWMTGSQMTPEQLESFVSIYYSTMDRRNSASEYYFPRSFFRGLVERLGEQCIFVFVMTPEGERISCELVLCSRTIAYSFLGGTLAEHNALRPNNYLKHELISCLKSRGITRYFLGGGNSEEDGIFRYKQTFAKNGVVDFYIGKKVYNKDVYTRLCQQWERLFPENKLSYGNFLLKYHY
jgi:hypothetical protein